MPLVTVAAAQFATAADVAENLDVCLEMIDEAADSGAELIVLPEFCNHLSVYDDADHCRRVAVDLDGPFVSACAARARARSTHVVLTVTVRRPAGVTVTNLLLDPAGRVAAEADKQTLMGNERAFLRPGPRIAPVTATPFGLVGMYSCMDGVTCEVPRALAVQGAVVLANSLNSFALDEAALHVPVRAAENQVFAVAANKVGPLVPAERIDDFAAALGVDAAALHGAGESQIVAPDGTVVAKAPRFGRAVVSAAIDLAEVARVRAARPMPARRPDLYAALAEPGAEAPPPGTAETLAAAAVTGPAAAAAALGSTADAPTAAAEQEVGNPRHRRPDPAAAKQEVGNPRHRRPDPSAAGASSAAAKPGAGGLGHRPLDRPRASARTAAAKPGGPAPEPRPRLVVMPELTEPPARIPEGVTVVFTRRDGDRHVGMAVGASGVVVEQPQLHETPRLPWARPGGDRLVTADLPWGRLAVVAGDDIRLPEVARLAAVQGAAVLAVCHRPASPADVDLMLAERAAENRVCIVAAAPAGPVSGCALIDPPADSLWSPSRSRPFDGAINMPDLRRIEPGADILVGVVHPARACNREISRQTNLVDGRSLAASARLAKTT